MSTKTVQVFDLPAAQFNVSQPEAEVQIRWDETSTFRNGWKGRLRLQLCCLTRQRARTGVMLRLLRCPRHLCCVLFRPLAKRLRECLPVLLLLPLTLGQQVLLYLIHGAAALLRLIRPRPVQSRRAVWSLQQGAAVTSRAPLQARTQLHSLAATMARQCLRPSRLALPCGLAHRELEIHLGSPTGFDSLSFTELRGGASLRCSVRQRPVHRSSIRTAEGLLRCFPALPPRWHPGAQVCPALCPAACPGVRSYPALSSARSGHRLRRGRCSGQESFAPPAWRGPLAWPRCLRCCPSPGCPGPAQCPCRCCGRPLGSACTKKTAASRMQLV